MWRSLLVHTANPLIQSSRTLLTRPVGSLVNLNTRSVIKSDVLISASVRFQSNSSVPTGNPKSELPKFDKKQKVEKEPNARYNNLFGVFVSGVVAYFGISYYLEYRKNQPQNLEIDYSSQYLPGIIKPSKTVN